MNEIIVITSIVWGAIRGFFLQTRKLFFAKNAFIDLETFDASPLNYSYMMPAPFPVHMFITFSEVLCRETSLSLEYE